jgi:hypothetical protein
MMQAIYIRSLILTIVLSSVLAFFSYNLLKGSQGAQGPKNENCEPEQSQSELTIWGSFSIDFLGINQ